jgi:glyoxylase-like metal-dependent hydrolase (beta-lactamase superfamily II)
MAIRNKLLTLPEDTVVYPGHDRQTTIAFEKGNNMFVR